VHKTECSGTNATDDRGTLDTTEDRKAPTATSETTTLPTGPIHLQRACGLSPSALLYSSYLLITVTNGNSTTSPQDSVPIFVAVTSGIAMTM
jgi:hypothetical protein